MLFADSTQFLSSPKPMRKILVIEDEALVRANISEILESGNFEAISAESGKVGLQLAKTLLPDLILCDIMMPELDGYEVLKILQSDPLTAAIPFIFLTAKADQSDLRQGMNLGADDYLTKPFRRNELLSVVEVRLEKQKLAQTRYHQEQKHLIQSVQKLEEQLNYLIYYDNLTNLPNQKLLKQQLENRLEQATEQQQSVSILSLDIDRFSRLNETVGYEASNQLLQAVAQRLQHYKTEQEILARLNGDQFVIVLEMGKNRSWAAQRANSFLKILNTPFCVNQQEVSLSASIGMSLFPEDGTQIDVLLQHADAALYQAKQQGRNYAQFYTPQINGNFSEVLALETSLHYALERSEFCVYYQPQINLKTGKVVGAEALLRWQHPTQGFISPAHFIPIAEQNGLILAIDWWVLQTVCQQLMVWKQLGLPALRVSVNLSGRHFQQLNSVQAKLFNKNECSLWEKIEKVLIKTGLESDFLDLEITESVVVQYIEENINVFKRLKRLGLHLSIDDFGTGYSSLLYLKQLPFDTLKIDRCFVRNLAQDSKNAAITKAIIQMAHHLNLKVIAEGVETPEELECLKELECDEMQGYLFSPPVTAETFLELLKFKNC